VAWFIGQSLVFIVVAFVVGVLVGWLWWGRRRPAPALAADGPTELLARPAPIADDGPTDALAPVPAQPVADPATDEEPTGVLPVPEPVATEPEPEPEPELVDVDEDEDLERIEGIGPKMSAALRAAGIRTYAALAGSDEARLRAAIDKAGLSFAPSLVTWARQARLLADGDEEGFADLTRRLVAGRDTGRA
jgi:predicted flap endonuclease-1-like 5' DNA nuclease